MCCEERDSAQLERDLVNNRFKHLESELETEKNSYTDRTREIRGLEVRSKVLNSWDPKLGGSSSKIQCQQMEFNGKHGW